MSPSGKWLVLCGFVIVLALVARPARAQAKPARAQAKPEDRLVRIAELEIDPAQLQTYTAALREEIATSIRAEPGVLSLYAVALKGEPATIRLFEIYASPAAYQSHLASPHFIQYKSTTQGMVKSLKLLETDPILLGSKHL